MRLIAAAMSVCLASTLAAAAPPRAAKGPPAVATQPQPEDADTPVYSYALKRGSSAAMSTLEIPSPKGAKCRVTSGILQLAAGVVPLKTPVPPGQPLEVQCQLPTGGMFTESLQSKLGFDGVLVIKAATPPVGMPDAAFEELLKGLRMELKADLRMDMIKRATAQHPITVEQVGKLVDVLVFSPEKVQVVELTADKIVDKENSGRLLQHFVFPADRKKVSEMLGN